MSENQIVLRVHELGKQYRIGEKRAPYRTIRETIMKGVKTPFRKAAGVLRGRAYSASDLREEIWALRDVSFDVQKGEVLGIIGRNGAGKTTLLKILSRITWPTEGWAKVYGRVSSLLEVGTGMHPELTGRENIYLNGSILGMRRAEIQSRFDDIVDFSGVERFIDTPLKHYSSGMQVRLAFSIAAHLKPEILMVDEVLAVGDAEFQKKCLGKMGEVAEGGKTVVFVSHNMQAILGLCNRAIYLVEGKVNDTGDPERIVSKYLGEGHSDKHYDAQGEYYDHVSFGIDPVNRDRLYPLSQARISVQFRPKVDVIGAGCYVAIYTADSLLVFALRHWDFLSSPKIAKGTSARFVFNIQSLPLLPGSYYAEVYLQDDSKDINDFIDNRFYFSVEEAFSGTTLSHGRRWFGTVAVDSTSGIEIIES